MPGRQLFSKRITDTLNDVHFVFTIMLRYPFIRDGLNYFKSNVSFPSVVMPMVYIYLSKVTNRALKIGRYMTMIETEAKGDPKWKQNLDDIKVLEDNYQFSIEPSFFPRREIDSVLLSNINWWEGTNHYDKKWIKNLLIYIPKNKDECCLIADAIKDAAKEYDYNIVPDIEYSVEEGCMIDFTLKSLKSQGVYDLCDEIKENYDVLCSKRKALLLDEQESAENSQTFESIVITEPGIEDEENTIFVENLDVSAIAKEIKTLSGYAPNSRIFAKTVHEAFKALGLLSDYTLTKFVAWGRKQKVFNFTSDVKGITESSDMKRKSMNTKQDSQTNKVMKIL